MNVKQILPSHADHITYYKDKYLDEMYQNEQVISQYKYDGERMLIHFDNGEVACTSRHISKATGLYTENQDKLPILKELAQKIKHLGYTIIDCECYSKDWSTIVGILHSLPERAIELQKLVNANFAVFDCIFFDGKDLRDTPYCHRLVKAINVIGMIKYKYMHLAYAVDVESYNEKAQIRPLIKSKEDVQNAIQIALDAGFEGVVVKSLARKYYDKGALLKAKKFETVDCVIVDYQQGTGKYSNTVGALILAYYDEQTDSFVKIGKCNCGTDEMRDDVNNNKDKYLHSVVEILCQEITNKSLRHPRFVRFRPDKDYKMCTRNTIFKS